jgi:hypothetical protein
MELNQIVTKEGDSECRLKDMGLSGRADESGMGDSVIRSTCRCRWSKKEGQERVRTARRESERGEHPGHGAC